MVFLVSRVYGWLEDLRVTNSFWTSSQHSAVVELVLLRILLLKQIAILNLEVSFEWG